MKKAILILLCFAMLVVAVSCNDNNVGEAETSRSVSSSSEKDNHTSGSQETTTGILPDTLKESPAEDFEYKENEDGGVTITGYIGNDKDVVIPSVINDKTVTEIGAMSSSTIASVIMPDSITEIKYGAFYNSKSLTTVKLSRNLSVIGAEAFMNCSALSDIVLPDSLTYIARMAFANCTSLKHIKIPPKVLDEESISVFNNSGLENVILEEQMIIPLGAFAYTKLTQITIPSSVKEIDNFAFWYCSELSLVQLNDGLQSMGVQVFDSTNLLSITIPSSVNNVTEDTFLGCSTLEKLFFEGDAPNNYKGDINYPSKYTIYFHWGVEGFSYPNWNGFKTEIW